MRLEKLLHVAVCGVLLLPMAAHAEAVIGQPAPALIATTFDGKSIDLAVLKGKVVVVNFWATWCPPCREEMPALEAVWRQYHGQGLEVLAVSADRPRSRGDATQVMQYFTFPAALLNELSKNDFGVPTALPVTYVIDKSGAVTDRLTPDTVPLTEAGLADRIKTLLAAKSDPPPSDPPKEGGNPESKSESAQP